MVYRVSCNGVSTKNERQVEVWSGAAINGDNLSAIKDTLRYHHVTTYSAISDIDLHAKYSSITSSS
jgi:hypothetical protein